MGIPTDLDQILRALNHKDLRIQTRARGLSPAGSQEALRDRLKEAMVATNDFALKNEDGTDATTVDVIAGAPSKANELKNNYTRPEGQNVGNYMTDRNSSRVLAPPGGKSQVGKGREIRSVSVGCCPGEARDCLTAWRHPTRAPHRGPPHGRCTRTLGRGRGAGAQGGSCPWLLHALTLCSPADRVWRQQPA
jgi:hypothetical protein